jgi:hypothetical protein
MPQTFRNEFSRLKMSSKAFLARALKAFRNGRQSDADSVLKDSRTFVQVLESDGVPLEQAQSVPGVDAKAKCPWPVGHG